MGKLILVRHGETNKNISNNLHTVKDSESLNDRGIKQIEVTAAKLTSYQPSKVYSSQERRALESAKIISSKLGIILEVIGGIEERNWGIFADKPWSEVEKILAPMTFVERYQYFPPGGESWKAFETRIMSAVSQITKDCIDRNIIVVTHGGVIRALMPYLLGLPKKESFKYNLDNASLTIFNYTDKGFTKVTINDTTHLKELR
jgi:alpha-ribazole phosphatase